MGEKPYSFMVWEFYKIVEMKVVENNVLYNMEQFLIIQGVPLFYEQFAYLVFHSNALLKGDK